jgi:hypothetical protein
VLYLSRCSSGLKAGASMQQSPYTAHSAHEQRSSTLVSLNERTRRTVSKCHLKCFCFSVNFSKQKILNQCLPFLGKHVSVDYFKKETQNVLIFNPIITVTKKISCLKKENRKESRPVGYKEMSSILTDQ